MKKLVITLELFDKDHAKKYENCKLKELIFDLEHGMLMSQDLSKAKFEIIEE